MAVYGTTKAVVLSFPEALWAETRNTGVQVVALCPGATDTAFSPAWRDASSLPAEDRPPPDPNPARTRAGTREDPS